MKYCYLLLFVALSCFTACKNNTTESKISKDVAGTKNHSYSNYTDVVPKHLDWKQNINFDKK